MAMFRSDLLDSLRKKELKLKFIGLLEFEKPLMHQLEIRHDKYHVQAIVQYPCLTCNKQAAMLWCVNNPFLCGIGFFFVASAFRPVWPGCCI